ncbi:MAG: hypothetical protein WCD18_21115, partial [Thermosynechococcaceae cyanobacterium]
MLHHYSAPVKTAITGLVSIPFLWTLSLSALAAPPKQVNFKLYPVPAFVSCLAASPYVTPTVD